jgi:hypothetical protein
MAAAERRDLGVGYGTGMTTRSQGAALRSPIFGAALLVLVLNDHWLKGAGLLPGWLTGKLSDLAGLIVAPVLLATLARARARHSRLACWAVVAAAFAAIKLCPAAARGVEHFTRWVGFGWRIWSDPTDLVALSVLPLGWWVLCRSGVDPAPSTHQRWWLERVAGIAAMLACVATSRESYVMETSVVIVNTTREAIELQVFRPSTALDCDAVGTDPNAALTAGDFVFESCTTLEPLEPVPLDLDWRAHGNSKPRLPPAGSARVCDAVLLRAPGLDDTVLFWHDVPKVGIDRYGGMPAEAAHVVSLEQVGDRLIAGGPDVGQTWPATFSVPEATCEVASP